jgi:hypothetical protein
MKPTTSDIKYFVGNDKTKCMWWTCILPSKISIFRHSHNGRTESRKNRPRFPVKILDLYFVHQTMRYLNSRTAWADYWNRFIEYLLLPIRVTTCKLKKVFNYYKFSICPHSKAGVISLNDFFMVSINY